MDSGDIHSATTDHRPSEHPSLPDEKCAVLIVNLGTPDEATPKAVRRYLREFLSDGRVVDLPRALWLPILHGVILNVRPTATARNYAKIWRTESNESPLRYYTRAQADALKDVFGNTLLVDWAMRYGNPSIRERMNALADAGAKRILILPLYPQYSATTTASVIDAVGDALGDMRWQPAIRTTPPFHDEPSYISALASIMRQRLNALEWTPERVLISFHGLPERYFLAGDPYHCHCAKTARLLRAEMGWADDFAPLTFQSIFGREKWLEPATEGVLKSLAEDGVKKVAVITPGFVADCVETLEEIAIAGRETFTAHGGEAFDAIPCLNDSPEMTSVLEKIIRRETAGWTPASSPA